MVPGFEDARLQIERQGLKHASPFPPVLGGQVSQPLVVTKVVGVVSSDAFLGRFLLGQYLAGEQGEALTLAGQGAFCRGEPPWRDASGLKPFRDAASDFHGRWDDAPAADGWGLAHGLRNRTLARSGGWDHCCSNDAKHWSAASGSAAGVTAPARTPAPVFRDRQRVSERLAHVDSRKAAMRTRFVWNARQARVPCAWRYRGCPVPVPRPWPVCCTTWASVWDDSSGPTTSNFPFVCIAGHGAIQS